MYSDDDLDFYFDSEFSESESESDSSVDIRVYKNSLPYLSHEFTRILELLNNKQSCYSTNIIDEDAPNPWLQIEGIGSIGIPLSERDAKLIQEHAIEVIPLSKNRDCKDSGCVWEIGAQFLECENPDWNVFLEQKLEGNVRALIQGPSEPFEFELCKLVLHGAGSTPTKYDVSDNAIGSLLISLPSRFTGGQIQITYNSQTQTYEPSTSFYDGATALAWYNVADHYSEPISSGYRFSLLYKIVHPPPAVSELLLPNIMQHVESELSRLLSLWSTAPKGTESSPDLVAVVLQERYSLEDINTGMACIKGPDAQQLSLFRTLTEKHGYMLCLAGYELQYPHLDNAADAWPWPYIYGGRRVDSSKGNITDMVDLKGNKLIHGVELAIDVNVSVALNPSEDDESDYVKYQTSLDGWDESTFLVMNCYYRTVLVIFKKDNKEEIMFSAYGLPYALDKLLTFDVADSPTVDENTIIEAIIKCTREEDVPERQRAMQELASHALRRKDFHLWTRVIGVLNSIEDIGTAILFEGFETFGLGRTLPLYGDLISHEKSLDRKVQFTYNFSRHASSIDDQFKAIQWINNQISRAIIDYKEGCNYDIPLIITLAHKGWAMQLCNLGSSGHVFEYEFATSLASVLQQEKQTILASVLEQSTQNRIEYSGSQSYSAHIDAFIDRLVNCSVQASLTWLSDYPWNTELRNLYIQRVIYLVWLCAFTRRTEACERVLALTHHTRSLKSTVKFYYMPLASESRQLFSTLKTGPCWTPFSRYMQRLIGRYLTTLLGTKTYNPRLFTLASFCPCKDCAQVYEFLQQPYVPRRIFKMSTKASFHVIRRPAICHLGLITEIVYVGGRIRGVLVTKPPKMLKAARWEGRLEQAREFLAAIGTDEEIALIMGDRYPALLRALPLRGWATKFC
ncbi:hypothetical protein AMATHDRAFT_4896 [Amanita thiersii Skay4041]|uniref:Uncharacterized protein n=1 Tax=Amanita thiersii Skay4041 TaxID=703135 RepID=A0A2A9NP44_9AGAR|nr:hypothetical protein AMATHDRAFT_4896 [Amanita thiersii Skay4041]